MHDLYDYIILCSDDSYSGRIKTELLERYMMSDLGYSKIRSLTFVREYNGEIIRVTGIPANSNGSYAFDTLDGVEEINLIEIDIPRLTNEEIEMEIFKNACSIAEEFSWSVYNRDISDKIYPLSNI